MIKGLKERCEQLGLATNMPVINRMARRSAMKKAIKEDRKGIRLCQCGWSGQSVDLDRGCCPECGSHKL